jgi:hypothetical protein
MEVNRLNGKTKDSTKRMCLHQSLRGKRKKAEVKRREAIQIKNKKKDIDINLILNEMHDIQLFIYKEQINVISL